MAFLYSTEGETHVHKCGYGVYCNGEILDQCAPMTPDVIQLRELSIRTGIRLDTSHGVFCSLKANKDGVVIVPACSACAGHYYS